MTKDEKQLPLNLKQVASKTFDNYVDEKNELLIASLQGFIDSEESLYYMWGSSGSGKSHLLQALSNAHESGDKSVVVINSKEIAIRENVSLIDLFDIICVDNIESITSDKCLEQSLFHWINEVRQANKKIILASQVSNKSQGWQLPDLRSRLQSGQTHELQPLGREHSLQVFKQQAKQQGLNVDQNVENFLTNNCSMNMMFLSKLLIQLDKETLVQKKPITIPLLKKIMKTSVVN